MNTTGIEASRLKTQRLKILHEWEDLEKESRKLLSDWQQTRPLMFERIYDTKSAGNLMPKQPADFRVLHKGVTSYVDLKHSKVSRSLKSCFSANVKSHQTSAARIVTRAGGRYWFIFYSLPADQFELWDGAYCFKRRSMGVPLELSQCAVFTSLEAVWTAAVLSELEPANGSR